MGTDGQTLCQNSAITNITYSIGGGATGASVTGLPTGVTASYAAGTETITGTPTVSGTFTYTVTTSGGSCGTTTSNGTITVNPVPTSSLSSAIGTDGQTLCQNSAITNITYSIGGGATGASVSGLPTGVTASFATGTETITGTPTVSGTFTYTVTTSGGSCGTTTSNGTITVNPVPTSSLSSAVGADGQTVCQNSAITDITYSIGGGATGASVSGLPTGVTASYAAGTETTTGTPTVSGTFTYTVTTSGGSCGTTTSNGTITVNPVPTSSLSSAVSTDGQTVCQNSAITDITYSIGGGATGASVTGLPTGVTASYAAGTETITGTPSVSGTFTYTVTTSGGSCGTTTSNGTITVNPLPTSSLSSAVGTDGQTVCQNSAITDITYSIGGGARGASVTGLPTGVTASYAAGTETITGTPSVSGTFTYTVTTLGGITCGTITLMVLNNC